MRLDKRHRNFRTIIGFLICGAAIIGVALSQQHNSINFQVNFSKLAYKIINQILLNPFFYLITLVTLYLEALFPARKEQQTFSLGLFQDSFWLISDITLRTLFIYTFLNGFSHFLSQIPGIELLSLKELPNIWRVVFGILAADLFTWFSHVLRHKIPVLWSFHAVHHSQRELNLFSDLRFHGIDLLVGLAFAVMPLALFDLSLPTAATYIFIQRWYVRIYHANLRTNLGALRYVLVTPQSHRIHHSIEPQHHDKNFATLFSVWDFIFQTQYLSFDEYPVTGITDPDFPLESRKGFLPLLRNYYLQNWYPFQKILRQ